jgi:cell division protein FtsB
VRARNPVTDFLSRLVILILFGTGVAAVFIWYLPLIQRNQSLRREIATQESRLLQLEEEIDSMNRQALLFEGNSNTVERLLRENLGYGLPGETVIRFESPPATNSLPSGSVSGSAR